ncbi:hypothetical protein OCF84_21615 (plasmid) [Shewanella xiamenensis]|uniref:Uncharacterized protein n=1 Tax=Shewanella xiamenensis TaxID=332186 RepID=A0ABT6UDI0_9GAMM|nr:hypothetical protein [Shewanella xiamenensis]MDI5832523.1 hypothetical protein [Shewanella xiamenensis]WHF57858.1 hypothetical protein OCF84_21615 [Shewanella xiamenensis]
MLSKTQIGQVVYLVPYQRFNVAQRRLEFGDYRQAVLLDLKRTKGTIRFLDTGVESSFQISKDYENEIKLNSFKSYKPFDSLESMQNEERIVKVKKLLRDFDAIPAEKLLLIADILGVDAKL